MAMSPAAIFSQSNHVYLYKLTKKKITTKRIGDIKDFFISEHKTPEMSNFDCIGMGTHH